MKSILFQTLQMVSFSLNTNWIQGTSSIEIIDITGKLVQTQTINTTKGQKSVSQLIYKMLPMVHIWLGLSPTKEFKRLNCCLTTSTLFSTNRDRYGNYTYPFFT
jgi:hypothetical protein